jgi:hypothetical protein
LKKIYKNVIGNGLTALRYLHNELQNNVEDLKGLDQRLTHWTTSVSGGRSCYYRTHHKRFLRLRKAAIFLMIQGLKRNMRSQKSNLTIAGLQFI